MLRFLLLLFLTLAAVQTPAQTPAQTRADASVQPLPLPNVGLSIIRTGGASTVEGMLFAGGSFTTKASLNFSAFLVKHGERTLLFDTGLGSHIDAQFQQDMPHWARLFFKYDEPVLPARRQLEQAGMAPVQTIILSHSHWDHASGIPDFPDATVWASAPELALIHQPRHDFGGNWPSQVGSPDIKWQTLEFKAVPFEGFSTSLDLFGDGSVVLVPLYGHTPGSVGMFVTVDSGHRYFLVGDAVWSAGALKNGSPKFWAARWLADADSDQTQQAENQIRAAMQRDPSLTVVPAHDGAVQQALGYFPKWVP